MNNGYTIEWLWEGITYILVHHPEFDGPIEGYIANPYYTVKEREINMEKTRTEIIWENFINIFNDKNIVLTEEGDFKWLSGMAAGSPPPKGFEMGFYGIMEELGYAG